MDSRVIHFEIPTELPERSTQFYSQVFGWKFSKWGEENYWLCETGDSHQPGINGAMVLRQKENQPVINTIGVSNIDQTIEAIKNNGGTIVVEKMPIEHIGWLVYFKDPDGNLFGALQNDPAAH